MFMTSNQKDYLSKKFYLDRKQLYLLWKGIKLHHFLNSRLYQISKDKIEYQEKEIDGCNCVFVSLISRISLYIEVNSFIINDTYPIEVRDNKTLDIFGKKTKLNQKPKKLIHELFDNIKDNKNVSMQFPSTKQDNKKAILTFNDNFNFTHSNKGLLMRTNNIDL